MKRLLIVLFVLNSITANAGLIDRGNGMVYDDILDVTWLKDANYAKTSGYDSDGLMTWSEANDWASNLEFGGFDDWRLFNIAPNDSNCSFIWNPIGEGYLNSGLNCVENEFGYHMYNNFGSIIHPTGAGLDNFNLFINIQQGYYWSNSNFSYNDPESMDPDSYKVSAWGFQAKHKWLASNLGVSNNMAAWALRSGDIMSVPEPATLLMLLIGVFGIGISGRKNALFSINKNK